MTSIKLNFLFQQPRIQQEGVSYFAICWAYSESLRQCFLRTAISRRVSHPRVTPRAPLVKSWSNRKITRQHRKLSMLMSNIPDITLNNACLERGSSVWCHGPPYLRLGRLFLGNVYAFWCAFESRFKTLCMLWPGHLWSTIFVQYYNSQSISFVKKFYF